MIRTAISPAVGDEDPAERRIRHRRGRLCAKTARRLRAGCCHASSCGLVSRLSASISSDADQSRPRLRRLDDVVDIAARRGDVRVGELRLVLRDQARLLRGRIVGRGDRVLEDDVDRALRAHDRDLGRRPREVHVAADVLAAHDVVRAAVCLAGDDRQLRDRRLAIGVQQLRAVLDDPAVFLGDARQEAGHVDERHERHVEAVAGPDEPRRLDRRVDVERAGEDRRLLRDDADAAAAEPREADEDVRRPARLDLEERRRRRRSGR